MVVAAVAVLWTLFVGGMAVARQDNLQTNAFDLGYVSQAVWYDGHGQPFRFSTVQGVSALLEGIDPSQIKHPHWLLAFHVEPALLLLAPLYRLWPDPRLLLWLQAAGLAAGALAAAALARRLLHSQLAALAFGLAWLLAPGLEGAALSDFHMVALGASLLMAGLWLFEGGHRRWALTALALAALCREDAAFAVAWLGLVLWVTRRDKVAMPRLLVVGAGVWTALCFLVIEPFFNGHVNVFAARYGWLLDAVRQRDVAAPFAWLATAPVRDYLGLELLTGGVLALLAPVQLLVALPLLAINALSGFDWMRSGGGHYSALLVPLLLWAAMHGVRRLRGLPKGLAGTWAGRPAMLLGCAVVLAAGVLSQAWIGASPLHAGFATPTPDGRAQPALAALRAVSPEAPVSATSALYPHLSNRFEAYWFPAMPQSEWLALDVAGTTHPLSAADMRQAALKWLDRPDVTVEAAQAGVLVLHRDPATPRQPLLGPDSDRPTLGAVLAADPQALPDAFYSFVLAGTRLPAGAAPLDVTFGNQLRLAGFQLRQWPQVGLQGGSATLDTYWQVPAATATDWHFALATTRASDGALSGFLPDTAAGPLWYPTSDWQPGQLYRLEMPVEQLAGVQALGVAVMDANGKRLVAASGDRPLWDQATIAEVLRLG